MSARIKSAATNSSVKKAPPGPQVTVNLTSGNSVSKLSRSVSKSDVEKPVKSLTSRLSALDHKASPTPRSVNSKPSGESARMLASSKPKQASDAGIRKVAVNSKIALDARALKLKLSTPPDVQEKRAPKALDVQAQMMVLQEDMKTAKEQLALALKEKAEVVDELEEARKIAGEANEKVNEAVAVQKRAVEAYEMEKVRAEEIVVAGIEKEEMWRKEMEDLRAQHASDADAHLSAMQEVLRLKEALAEISDGKNQAISLADVKCKESEAYREKVELLTEEITDSKGLLESKIEAVELLKLELEKSRSTEEKLEAKIEELNSELNESKTAHACSNNMVKEWKQKVEELEQRVEEANTKERSMSESLSSLTNKLEETQSSLQESEQKTSTLMESIAHTEAAVDELHIELEASREAEAKLRNVVEDWKQIAKKLEKEVEEANLTEKTALDSLSTVKMQLEETRGLLQEAEKKVVNLTKKISESGAALEQASVQLEASRMAEAYANSLVNEWKDRVEELEDRVEEANDSEQAMKKSLSSVNEELETSRESLKKAEVKIDALEEKVGLLEMSFERQRGDHKQAENRAATAEADAVQMAKMIESLKIELDAVQEEKLQAAENEKLTASNVQSLLEEKNKLINELENSQFEEEKSKKAMESLAAALHEVSAEAREAKENFLARQAEHETYESQIDDLKCILKETNEKYETMLDDARHEVDSLIITIEKFKKQSEESKTEWEESKSELVNSVKQSEEEKSALENEIKRLTKLLKEYEEGRANAESEKARLMKSLNEVESEVERLQSVLDVAKADSTKLKESLLHHDNELRDLSLQNEMLLAKEADAVSKMEELSKQLDEAKADSTKLKESLLHHENELRELSLQNEILLAKEADAVSKMEELSKQLDEAVAKNKNEENGSHIENRNSFEFLPKSIIPETEEDENEVLHEDHIANDHEAVLTGSKLFQDMKGDSETDEKHDDDESAEMEAKDSSSQEKELEESCDEELVDIGEISFDKRNGSSVHIENNSTPPSTGQKKKKAMLGKFGSLLKKKNSSSSKSRKPMPENK